LKNQEKLERQQQLWGLVMALEIAEQRPAHKSAGTSLTSQRIQDERSYKNYAAL
ncbi:hypothetical protein scyTo_0026949, partial [Scyliorhinus torazame]|nr:hypothetical protein [Scyliorhinus torazame]